MFLLAVICLQRAEWLFKFLKFLPAFSQKGFDNKLLRVPFAAEMPFGSGVVLGVRSFSLIKLVSMTIE